MSDDPYEVLQVSPNAEPEVIDVAYRRLARKYHPDVDPDPAATSRMQRINWAYEILRNPITRASYDRQARAQRAAAYTPGPAYRAEPRPRASYTPRAESTPGRAGTEKPPESPASSTTLSPHPVVPVLIASSLLAAFYALASLFYFLEPSLGSLMGWLLIALALGGSGLLAIAAAAGWNPAKITVWRVLVMLPLTFYPILSWIPCYLAGKAIARKTARKVVAHPSRLPALLYGAGAVLLSFLVFGGPGARPEGPTTADLQYSSYRESQIGVSFQHPLFLSPSSQTTRERTELGTVFTVTVITAESASPSAALAIRIIEDPTREQMFPGLYPPDEDALRALALSDIAQFQFTEDEVSQDDLVAAAQDSNIITIAGFPAAEYSITANDTAWGDAAVRGAFVVTDEWDVSLLLVASTEAGLEGSLSPGVVDQIWNHLKSSLVLEH
jgi:hypothetical protein